MAQQGTDEQTSDQQASEEAAGKHRASDEGTDETSGSSESADAPKQAESSEGSSGETSGSDEAKTEQSAPSEAKTEQSASDDAKTEQSAPSEAKTEQSARDDAPTEQRRRGSADTSWAEPETQSRRHVDVGEIVWRAGNVVATVVRTLAFLFALVLIVNVVLVLVGVNPANGVAQFIGGVADTVILGFRDLFLPSDPKIALIVNSLIAAVFWVFVGELLSRLIRFIAARVK